VTLQNKAKHNKMNHPDLMSLCQDSGIYLESHDVVFLFEVINGS
jgi:hypothetical protein